MTAVPEFRRPGQGANDTPGCADIIQIDRALESMRDSGFDLTAAAGEPIDNSVEANANVIRLETTFDAKKKTIEAIAFADDGDGIDPGILAHVLSMGYSSRYGARGGLGRFGVGLKLAGLSLGRRIDVYSLQRGTNQIWHAYLDLQEISDGSQKVIEAVRVDSWPDAYLDLMVDRDGDPVTAGTLVVYGNIDRLTSGGHYGTALDEKIAELRTFIARAYRCYLQKGLQIELNGKPVTLLDPMFLMDNPRIIKRYSPQDVRGSVVQEDDIEIVPGKFIHVIVTLVPVEFRYREGDGGRTDHLGRDINEFQIADSAGKISMIRNGREINYDIVPRLLPAGIDKVDRYIGIEVRFPAELDEFFQVRNVKRGAVPVHKLREELRSWLERPVRRARSEVRKQWGEVKTRERAQTPSHGDATAAVARVEVTSPAGLAGRDLTPEQSEQLINDLINDLQLNESDHPEAATHIRDQIQEEPITLVDASWPGSELFEIVHLNGKAIVKINHRHPFWRDVYGPIKAVADNGNGNLSEDELVSLLRKAEGGIDALVLAYAKAENLHKDPTIFNQLRTYWGTFTASYLAEIGKGE